MRSWLLLACLVPTVCAACSNTSAGGGGGQDAGGSSSSGGGSGGSSGSGSSGSGSGSGSGGADASTVDGASDAGNGNDSASMDSTSPTDASDAASLNDAADADTPDEASDATPPYDASDASDAASPPDASDASACHTGTSTLHADFTMMMATNATVTPYDGDYVSAQASGTLVQVTGTPLCVPFRTLNLSVIDPVAGQTYLTHPTSTAGNAASVAYQEGISAGDPNAETWGSVTTVTASGSVKVNSIVGNVMDFTFTDVDMSAGGHGATGTFQLSGHGTVAVTGLGDAGPSDAASDARPDGTTVGTCAGGMAESSLDSVCTATSKPPHGWQCPANDPVAGCVPFNDAMPTLLYCCP